MGGESNEHTVVAFLHDMIFESKIGSTARSLGVGLMVVRSAGDLPGELERTRPALLIVDLASPGALEAIKTAAGHAARPRVIAYVSHVDEELAKSGLDVGADEVMPRSRFANELPRLLERVRGDPSRQDTKTEKEA